ncbi:MAG: cytochrome c oxidase assembly protein [Bryobacteraceae bacterium]
MDPALNAAAVSWPIDAPTILILAFAALVFVRGWLRGRRVLREHDDSMRLASFLAGLGVLFLALESPLDAFDSFSLSAHMTQHLLLIMIAPPLILLSRPVLPLLRGIPKPLLKEGLAPFLTWVPLRGFLAWLVTPPVAFAIFAVNMIGWHLPVPYEFALSAPVWHRLEHACFFWSNIIFWWHVIQPGPGKSKWPRWTAIPYLLAADIVNTAVSASLVFAGRLIYPSYAIAHSGSMTPIQDQALGGTIMWVPGSIIYLIPVAVIAMGMLTPSYAGRAWALPVRPADRGRKKALRFRIPASKLPLLRRLSQVAMLLVAIAVMADGFFGPQVSAINMAGVLPWIHWRALSLFALLVVGNLFCMACPFTLVRDIGRKVLPANRHWPRRLRNKWLAVGLFALYLWSYEAFGIWNSPWMTAWIMVGYFSAAVLVDGLFRGASFCKYVCPIGQFHFVTSLLSPREVGVKRASVCRSCRTHDCIRGNEHARGCELFLFQPEKSGNLDCTFCMDCVKACPHDNVALVSITPGKALTTDPYRSSIGRLSKRSDFTALALVVVFGAFVNAAGMVSPVMAWEHGWHAWLGSMSLVIGIFIAMGVIVAPAIAFVLARTANRLVLPRREITRAARRFALALVPVGIAMWAAHLLYHFGTGWMAAVPVVERAITGVVTFMTMQPVPDWLTKAQLGVLDAGLLLTFYVCWRVATQYATRARSALALAAPWAVVSCALYAAGVWILFQPMQMRGLMHGEPGASIIGGRGSPRAGLQPRP